MSQYLISSICIICIWVIYIRQKYLHSKSSLKKVLKLSLTSPNLFSIALHLAFTPVQLGYKTPSKLKHLVTYNTEMTLLLLKQNPSTLHNTFAKVQYHREVHPSVQTSELFIPWLLETLLLKDSQSLTTKICNISLYQKRYT